MAEQKKTVDMDNRKKALELALTQIEKQFGKGAIMKLDGTASTDIDAISTGCLSLDLALGVGGVPRGRVVEIYGPEASGKTTLTLSIIAQIQKMSGAIEAMSMKFSEETVSLAENVRLIVEVLKQFRLQSSNSMQELSEEFNEKVKDLWEKKSIEVILKEEKKAIDKIKQASQAISNNLYYAQLLTIIQSIREETIRIIGGT